MGWVTQMRRTVVGVKQLLALINWGTELIWTELNWRIPEMLFGGHLWRAPALHPSRGVGAVQTPDPDQPHLGPPMALEPHLKLSLHLDLLLLSRTGGWPSLICQAPDVLPAPLPGQPAALWCSPGEAPRFWVQLLLWMIWPGIMIRISFPLPV